MSIEASVEASFDELWTSLLPVGRASTGGYRRHAWTPEDTAARDWFVVAARSRGLDLDTDRNGNLWAWWLPQGWSGEPRQAFVTGSHLDSVPDGGAFDGPLGVVSGLCAIDVLRARDVVPTKPVAVTVFADEEGARFGVACAGSRLLTGALAPDRARALTDAHGVTMDDAMRKAGVDPARLGRDDEMLGRIGVLVELHIEQGRALVERGSAVGVGTGIWPHGRWRFGFTGKADHAGTTRLRDRRDPVLSFAATVLAARESAERHDGLATFGRIETTPNATNAVAFRVDSWLDARASTHHALDAIVRDIEARARTHAESAGVVLDVVAESATAAVGFSAALRASVHGALGPVPDLATGAGHDAGVLAAEVPTAMLFVRNRTGVSHAPDEFADRADCLAGVDALAAVMADWACR